MSRWESMTSEELDRKTKVVQQCFNCVQAFFGGDKKKTDLWFRTGNPLLGGLSPDGMVFFGREDKLLKMIKNQLDGNHE